MTDTTLDSAAETTIRNGVHCRDCGKIISPTATVCPHCGGRQMANTFGNSTPAGKNRFIAAFVALFFGGFGIHKFYLGRIGWGIVYLLFFWTGIPAIIAFIEAIVYLCMSDEAFAAKYG